MAAGRTPLSQHWHVNDEMIEALIRHEKPLIEKLDEAGGGMDRIISELALAKQSKRQSGSSESNS